MVLLMYTCTLRYLSQKIFRWCKIRRIWCLWDFRISENYLVTKICLRSSIIGNVCSDSILLKPNLMFCTAGRKLSESWTNNTYEWLLLHCHFHFQRNKIPWFWFLNLVISFSLSSSRWKRIKKSNTQMTFETPNIYSSGYKLTQWLSAQKFELVNNVHIPAQTPYINFVLMLFSKGMISALCLTLSQMSYDL